MINKFSEFSLFRARNNVFRLQRRIFKSVFVGDITSAFRIQKILISSNSSRFLANRYVTYTKSNLFFRELALNLVDKFRLNQYLIDNVYNWKPCKMKKFSFLKNNSIDSNLFEFWSIFDYSWQCLIKFAIEPAQEAVFSPRNLGFRSTELFYEAQKVIFLNLGNDYFGLQKKVIIVNFKDFIQVFNYSAFFKKILAPRFVKIGIFRFLKLGFHLGFDIKFKEFSFFNSLLANVLLTDIDFFFNSVRVGSNMLFFLRPFDNETLILNKIKNFLFFIGIDKV